MLTKTNLEDEMRDYEFEAMDGAYLIKSVFILAVSLLAAFSAYYGG